MTGRVILSLLVMAFIPVLTAAVVIHVPADYLTIGEAIENCISGDSVMVAPGTYAGAGNRNISTEGKAITISSSDGPLATVIDGGIIEDGFYINGGEDSTTIIDGFTIINAYNGVYCDSSAPVIRNMVIKDFLNHGIHFDGFLSDPPVKPVVEDCLVFQERLDYQGTGIGLYGTRGINVTVSGCLFTNFTYGLEFVTIDNTPPGFDIEKCIIKNNIVDGIWTHA